MGEYETLLELYQAQNAVQIAQASGAAQYAGDVLSKAQTQLQSAQALHDRKVDKSLVIAAAREASKPRKMPALWPANAPKMRR